MDLSSRVNFRRRLSDCVCTAPMLQWQVSTPSCTLKIPNTGSHAIVRTKDCKTKLVAGVLKQDQNTQSQVKKNVFIRQYKTCVKFQWKHLPKQRTVHTLMNDDMNKCYQLVVGGDDCRRMPEWGRDVVTRLQECKFICQWQNVHRNSSWWCSSHYSVLINRHNNTITMCKS